MSTLHLDEPPTEQYQSNAPLIFRTALVTVLAVAILGNAFANYYFYYQHQELNAKLDALQAAVTALNDKSTDVPDFSGLESKIDDVNENVTKIKHNVDSIKSDVDDMQLKIGNIEDDVSSIQMRIGY